MDLGLEGWSDFNVAMVGATAALAGLVIVAASVNVEAIIKSLSLTARLATVIANLMVALAGSAIALMPGVDGRGYGVAVLLLGGCSLGFHVHAVRRIRAESSNGRLQQAQVLSGFVAPLGFLVGGALVLAGSPSGVVWFGCASIVAIAYTLGISWIVLIEVLR